MNKRKTLEAEMILFSCCIFLEKSWVHNTTQQLLVLGTQHQLMKLWMLVVGYTTTNCTKVGCWVHNNQQISDVVLCCVGSCWYNPCLVLGCGSDIFSYASFQYENFSKIKVSWGQKSRGTQTFCASSSECFGSFNRVSGI